jgi:hypothetical protein
MKPMSNTVRRIASLALVALMLSSVGSSWWRGFVIGDVPASAWRRLGLALERIDGVTIDSRAELLSVYNVSFGGSSFLVKIAPEGEGSRISTVSEAGQELTSGAPGRLLALLKERLG